MQSKYMKERPGLHLRLAQSGLSGSTISVSANKQGSGNIFRRAPFRPNFITNTVFLLSIFQNMITVSVNHSGKPFHGSLLESKQFCLWAAMSTLFCIGLVLEVQPEINQILQLAPMLSNPFQIFMLSLFAFDGAASFLADLVCVYFLDREQWNAFCESEKTGRSRKGYTKCKSVADMEDELLQTEILENKRIFGILTFAGITFIAKHLMF